MTPASTVAILLALAVLVASARMLLGLRRSEASARPRIWRVIALLALQVASAWLLYWTLLPPAKRLDAGTMVVLTAEADRVDRVGARDGEYVIALPEADSASASAPPLARAASRGRSGGGAFDVRSADNAAKAPLPDPPLRLWRKGGSRADHGRVPDLATALRRHPGTTRLRILGDGLPARDRDATRGLALEFAPSPLPRGIVELWSPDRIQAGAQVRVSGRVEGVAGGSAELLDPGGVRSDRATLGKDGRFSLAGNARGAGFAAFRVRVRDVKQAIVEEAAVPLQVVDGASRRVLILAGGPSPELKYLRRWAADAGLSLHTQITLGGGIQLGDAPLTLDAATLAKFDLVVLDERAWQSLGDARHAVLRESVRGGLGVLLRVTGPLSARERTRLRAAGIAIEAAKIPETVRLATALRETANGETNDGDGGSDTENGMPTLTRRALRIDATDGTPLLRDANGAALAVWRAEGRGRIAVWTLADSFRLVLGGHDGPHARLWSDAFATVARARGVREPVLDGEARQGQRTILCGIASNSAIETPEDRRVALIIDPASGSSACAGFWPTAAGWHQVRTGDTTWPFHVLPRDALPGVQARTLREATARLASVDATTPISTATAPGPRWPWFLAWLAVSGLVWWLERVRYGRR